MLDFININTDQMMPRISGFVLEINKVERKFMMLQGDLLLIEYRNILITLAK
jgi:hypothetical protein